jgi:hypothetical protein
MPEWVCQQLSRPVEFAQMHQLKLCGDNQVLGHNRYECVDDQSTEEALRKNQQQKSQK